MARSAEAAAVRGGTAPPPPPAAPSPPHQLRSAPANSRRHRHALLSCLLWCLLLVSAFFACLPVGHGAAAYPFSSSDQTYYNWSLAKPHILLVGIVYPTTAFSMDFPGINLAFAEANRDPRVLPNHTLVAVYEDSGVNAADSRLLLQAAKQLLDLDGKSVLPRVSMLIGPNVGTWVSSFVDVSLSFGVHPPVLTPFAAEVELADANRFSRLLRLTPSDDAQAQALAFLAYTLGWRRIGVLTSEA